MTAAATGPFGDLTQHVLLGGWLLVAPIAIAIIRRPFAGILAEIIASVIEVVFLGSAVGPLLLVAAALQGAGSELPFAKVIVEGLARTGVVDNFAIGRARLDA